MRNFNLHTVFIVATLPLFFFITMCGAPSDKRQPDKIAGYDNLHMEVRTADTTVIYWDAPQTGSDSVKYYELYYHTQNDPSWQSLLKNIPPSKTPEVTIKRSALPSTESVFFFSIKYYTVSGAMSSLHSSTDATANPPGGWYMYWK